MTHTADIPSPQPEIAAITGADLGRALRAGWSDFRAAPAFGVAFSAVYVAGGLALLALTGDFFFRLLIVAFGFPLVAPFAAVGLYEVSRRREAGERLRWGPIVGAVAAERDRQIPWMGATVVIFFLIWIFLAHVIFALFMGLGAITDISTSWAPFLTMNGIAMIAAELVLGGALAWFLFALTAFSLPMLLDREIDIVTAMRLSVRVVRASPGPMLAWAAVIAVLLLLAMLPWFLGLFVVLPVLGHATWHLYRHALGWPA